MQKIPTGQCNKRKLLVIESQGSQPDFNAMKIHAHCPILMYWLLLLLFTGYTITGTSIGSTWFYFWSYNILLVMYNVYLSEDLFLCSFLVLVKSFTSRLKYLNNLELTPCQFKKAIKVDSASLLESAVTCLPMFPFIVLAIFLMDRVGRR